MCISKKLLILAIFLACFVPFELKAQEPVLFGQESVGSTVAIEQSVMIAEPIEEEDMPWWVYLWAGLLVAGAVSISLKSIKEQIRKPHDNPEEPPDKPEPPQE